MTGVRADPPRVLIVIPCLDEAEHIGALLDGLAGSTERLGATVAVVDGGSRDGTQDIVRRRAEGDGRIVPIDNPRRIQSAAINLAVRELGDDFDVFIRIDAHGGYPPDYCDRLVEEAIATGAASVVVSMQTAGAGTIQGAVAVAQNSRLGTGGSPHRHASTGRWVDHGHHALMQISAFRDVGGYDESFSHNEDAELDHRLGLAGHRIWLTARTRMTYYPRSSLARLYRQYLGYGRGRAKNAIKHRVTPKLRQLAPLMVFPSCVMGLLSFVHWSAGLPFLAWAAICVGFGAWTAMRDLQPRLMLAGISAMVMHFAWSLGFWLQLAESLVPRREATP